MRHFVDISNYDGITDIKYGHCVMDGKIYKFRESKYDDYTATIPREYLINKVPCVLANRDHSTLIYSYEDGVPCGSYYSTAWIGDICTQLTNGRRFYIGEGGGYRRRVK